jgi:flagellar biosynthesis/type III secretory pathway protein FliH
VLEGSRVIETRPIDQLATLLAKPEDDDLRRTFVQWLTRVFLPSRLPGVTVTEVKKLEEVSSMIQANAIDWSAQWREEGWRKGRQEGRREGRRKGEAEGRRKGEADLLLRQLSRLYGPLPAAVEERVRDAEADQLLEWGERLVTSRSLDEVFTRA